MTIIDHTNKNYSLIRYMDLAKFLSLLDENTLFFCRADLLSNDDPYEGDYTRADYQSIVEPLLAQIETSHDLDFQCWNIKNLFRQDESEIRKPILYSIGVNCWHIADCQSLAMWKIYSSNTGIAIKTDLSKLKEALSIENSKIFEIAKVEYIDYKNDKILQDPHYIFEILNKIQTSKTEQEKYAILNETFPFFVPLLIHKRNAYEYENELRVLTRIIYNNGENIGNKVGEKCFVNINSLIDEIWISPYAPDWFVTTLRNLLKSKYGINKPIYKSDLNINLVSY